MRMKIFSSSLVFFLMVSCTASVKGGKSREPSGISSNESGQKVTAEVISTNSDDPYAGISGDDLSTPLRCPVKVDPMNFGPIVWPEAMAHRRWMGSVTQAANVKSSKARPVEVCGVQGELMWLISLTCPDGNHPYPDTQTAHMSRSGSVGAGGRCGKIIDLYIVPCSEKQYEVYMDMYQCAPGETFQ